MRVLWFASCLHTTISLFLMKSVLSLVFLKCFLFINTVFNTKKKKSVLTITKIKILGEVTFYETYILLLWAVFSHDKAVMQTLLLIKSIYITTADIYKKNKYVGYFSCSRGRKRCMRICILKRFLCVVMTKKLFLYPPEKYILKQKSTDSELMLRHSGKTNSLLSALRDFFYRCKQN